MAFKPRVVIAEVRTLAQKPIQLETENEKLIITSFNGVACDIMLRSWVLRGFPAVGFICHKSSQPNLTLSGGVGTFDSD